MDKILLLYAPKGGNVEKVSKAVSSIIGNENSDMLLIEEVNDKLISKISSYNKFVFIISTIGRSNWDSFYTKIGWDLLLNEIRKLDLSNKIGSIIGLGDSLLYPDNFVDSMGILYEALKETNIKLVGRFDEESYEFGNSMAIENGKFVGLPIDQDNEKELTEGRIKNWFEQVKKDFGL